MIYLIFALLIGIVAGLRAMTPPTVVSWGAYHGWLAASGTALGFLGLWWVPWAFTLLAFVEFLTDQMPAMPRRTAPLPFGLRIATGALSGGCIAARSNHLVIGAILGAIGAVIGTLGGMKLRDWLRQAFRHDRPAGVLEDGIAVVAALLIVSVA